MKRIINKGLDFYQKKYEKNHENHSWVESVGTIMKEKDGQILKVNTADVEESSKINRIFNKFLRELDEYKSKPTTIVKILDVQLDKDSYKKTEEEIFVQAKVQLFHLGEKEHWDSEDYMLMEVGATDAIGNMVYDLFPEIKSILDKCLTSENIYIDEYFRKKHLVTITGKYGLWYR